MAKTYSSGFLMHAGLLQAHSRLNKLQARLAQIQNEKQSLMHQIDNVTKMENLQKETSSLLLSRMYPNGFGSNLFQNASLFGTQTGVTGLGSTGGSLFGSMSGSSIGSSAGSAIGSSAGSDNFINNLFGSSNIGGLGGNIFGNGSIGGNYTSNPFGDNFIMNLMQANSMPWSISSIGTSTGNTNNLMSFEQYLRTREEDLEQQQNSIQLQIKQAEKDEEAFQQAMDKSLESRGGLYVG